MQCTGYVLSVFVVICLLLVYMWKCSAMAGWIVNPNPLSNIPQERQGERKREFGLRVTGVNK